MPHRHQEIMRNNLRVSDCAMQSEENPTKWEGKPHCQRPDSNRVLLGGMGRGDQEDMAVQWEP